MRTRGRTYGRRKKYNETTPSPEPAPTLSRRGRKKVELAAAEKPRVPHKVRASERLASKQAQPKAENDSDSPFKGVPAKYLNLFKSDPAEPFGPAAATGAAEPIMKRRRIGKRGAKG